MCKLPNCNESPLLLVASFYIFHMEYTQGLTNVYTFLEYTLLDKALPKDGKTKVKHFLAQIAHHEP